MSTAIPTPDSNNAWRLETPGHAGWTRTARPGDPDKYWMISSDGHLQEPGSLWQERIEARYRDRLPRMTVDEKGNRVQTAEGMRPVRFKDIQFEGEDGLRQGAGGRHDPRQPGAQRHGSATRCCDAESTD